MSEDPLPAPPPPEAAEPEGHAPDHIPLDLEVSTEPPTQQQIEATFKDDPNFSVDVKKATHRLMRAVVAENDAEILKRKNKSIAEERNSLRETAENATNAALDAKAAERSQKLRNEKLKEQITWDKTTGLMRREPFLEELEHQAGHSNRANDSEQVNFVAMLDIDYFKKVNDSLGHAAGDKVLGLVGQAIKDIFGDQLSGRLGGEEFGIFVKGKNLAETLELFETLQRVLNNTPIDEDNPKLGTIGISIGVADQRQGTDPFDALMMNADQALYKSKHTGRNKITVDGHPDEPTGTKHDRRAQDVREISRT